MPAHLMSSRPRSLPNCQETLSLQPIPEPSLPQEGGSFVERQDANISPSHGAETILLDQPPRRKQSSDEYRRRADACLSWAREASTDDVRLACLALATAWLKAAVREDGDGSEHLPLAPAL